MRAGPVILAAVMLVGAAPVFGQDVAVRGSVEETTVGTEERVVFNLEIEGASLSDVETPEPPNSRGLVLLQRTPNVRRNMMLINGALQQSVTYSWAYRPAEEGRARLESVEVKVGDETFATEAIDLTIVAQAQRPRRPSPQRQQWPFVLPSRPQADAEEEREIEARDLFIRAVPSTTTARQNEQVTVEYRLYFRDGIQLRHSRLAGSWDAEGFWREEFDVETRPIPNSVVEDGLLYHTIVLKRVAVFPTRPGTLTIDPLEIETEAYLPVRSADAFERFFSLRDQFETVELASEPVRLHVEALPANAPPGFAGAVGSFTLRASVDRTNVEVGESVEVTVNVRGSGNLSTLDAPRFEPPGIFDRYEPEIESAIDRSGRRIEGSKQFRYTLVPRSNGTFDIPPITFTYFDPDRDQYVTEEQGLPEITVTGTAAPLASGTTADGLPVDDIAPLMTRADGWHAIDRTALHRRVWPYAALILPFGLVLGLYLIQRRADRLATDRPYARRLAAHPLARKHLKRAQELLADDRPRAFYEEIERAVTGFIGNRLDVPETGLTRAQLDARLNAVGVPPEDRDLLRRLLDESDQARFAPVLPDRSAMESARDRAAHLIVAVDEAAERYRSEMAAA